MRGIWSVLLGGTLVLFTLDTAHSQACGEREVNINQLPELFTYLYKERFYNLHHFNRLWQQLKSCGRSHTSAEIQSFYKNLVNKVINKSYEDDSCMCYL